MSDARLRVNNKLLLLDGGTCICQIALVIGGVLDVKQVGSTIPDGGNFIGCSKRGFLVSTSPKETGNPLFYTRGGALRPKIH
jgi:hypothetical protein